MARRNKSGPAAALAISLTQRKKKWELANPGWSSLQICLRRYGLTLDQYHAKAEAQDFLCAICGDEGQGHIDHNHETGQLRGLLCGRCNRGLGMFRESVQALGAAQDYLNRHVQ